MVTDWKALQEEMGGSYKSFLTDGEYETKCDGIEIKEVGSKGSVIMKFHLEDIDEGQFPTIDHWMSFKNDNFRKWHNRCLMIVFGASADNAEKAVDVCEGKSGKENIMKAYEAAFKKLLSKKPTIKVEVYTDGNYAKAEFLDRSVSFPHGDETQNNTKSDDILSEGEELDLEDSDLPF